MYDVNSKLWQVPNPLFISIPPFIEQLIRESETILQDFVDNRTVRPFQYLVFIIFILGKIIVLLAGLGIRSFALSRFRSCRSLV